MLLMFSTEHSQLKMIISLFMTDLEKNLEIGLDLWTIVSLARFKFGNFHIYKILITCS